MQCAFQLILGAESALIHWCWAAHCLHTGALVFLHMSTPNLWFLVFSYADCCDVWHFYKKNLGVYHVKKPANGSKKAFAWHCAIQQAYIAPISVNAIDVKKKRFFTILSMFLFLKRTFTGNSVKKFEKHFWSHRNELILIGLDFIMKWLGMERACAYSDTAAVTSCSRQSQYVKSWIATTWIKFSLSLVPAIMHLLGIRQEVEQIRANVFYSTVFFIFFSRAFLHT